MSKKDKKKKTLQNKNPEIKLKQFELKDSYVIIFFALITVLFFKEILLQQKFFWEDFILALYPFRNFASVSLSNWTLPFWNPYTFGGMPFLADIQTAVFYPLHLLLTLFVKNDQLHFAYLEYLIVFHYFMAGVFSYYLARSLDLNKWASILAGITFMFCGFMVTHAIHETMVIQFAYMPFIFMFYNKSFNTSKLKYILLTGLFMGIAILCGHPQITLYTFFTFLLFGLYQIFFKFKESNYKINFSLFKIIAIAAIPFVIGIMLGAIQLFPTMKLAELSARAEISYQDSLEGYLYYFNLITLFSPHFFGKSDIGRNVAGYWGHYLIGTGTRYAHMYWESCIYIGLSALVFGILGIIAFWKKRIIKFLVAISLLSILYILGDNFILHKLFYNYIPGFDKFRFIGRFGLIFAFSFSLLGAYGFDYFINNADGEKVKKFIKGFIILVSGFIVLWLLFQIGLLKGLTEAYQDKSVYNYSALQLFKTIILLFVLFGLVILFRRKSIPQYLSLFLFIMLAFIDLYIFGSEHNNSAINITSYYRNREDADIIVNIIKEEYNYGLFRIKVRTDDNSFFFDQNQGMIDFIFMLDGYNPLNLKNKFPPHRTDDLMNVKYVAIHDTVVDKMDFEFNEDCMPRAWVSYYSIVEPSLDNVAKILDDSTFDIRKKVIIDQEPEIFIDTNLTDDDIAGYKTDIISYEINEITLLVETNENSILVLSEVYYPNWKVFVDDVEKPMLRADYSLRAVAVEKGTHTVVFKYIDKDFQLGAIITLFALAMVIGGFVVERYRGKK